MKSKLKKSVKKVNKKYQFQFGLTFKSSDPDLETGITSR